MKKEENDIFNMAVESAKKVKLTENERVALFSRIDAFVKRNPIPDSVLKTQVEKADGKADMGVVRRDSARSRRAPADIRWFTFITSGGARSFVFAVAIFLILGTSTSFAAQGALPGDTLYPLKINVNEKAAAFFVRGVDRAIFEAELAARRLKEVETLARGGRLTVATKNQAEANFKNHVGRVERNVEEFKGRGELKEAFRVSSKLENSLMAREAALSDLRFKDGEENDREMEKVISMVQVKLETSSMMRKDAENTIVEAGENNESMKVVAEAKLKAVKTLTQGAREKTLASSADLLAETNTLTVQGEEKLKQGEYKEAVGLFRYAHDLAEDARFLNELEDEERFDQELELDKSLFSDEVVN